MRRLSAEELRDDAIAEKARVARLAALRPGVKCTCCGQPECDDVGAVAGRVGDDGLCLMCSLAPVRR